MPTLHLLARILRSQDRVRGGAMCRLESASLKVYDAEGAGWLPLVQDDEDR